ncbi:MAG: potassium efflux system protein [Desulforhopalus sp.]|jgi:potassium efflux system protein
MGDQQLFLFTTSGSTDSPYSLCRRTLNESNHKGILKQTILPAYGIDIGVQFSIIRLVSYFVSLIVFIVLLSVLGIELTKLTIFGSALGIGVGFGLQAVVNNFVSGLILLFERPIKIGDTVQISNEIGVVQNVGLRATVIQTFGNAEIVIPNSDLVTGQVINWSLTEKRVRLDIPVGVSYSSDVDQVLEILQELGYEHPLVMSQPPPKSLFLGFGDNSLNFELRVWLNNYIDKFDVLSELNREIEYEFSQKGIKIPYPQRDLHLKSNDISSLDMVVNNK